jgi:hypothetical protein
MKRLLAFLLFLFLFCPTANAGMVVTDLGAEMALGAYLNNSWPAGGKNFTLKLYCTNVTPLETHTAANYTACTGGGYADKTLTNGSWVISIASNISQAAYAAQTFTFTGTLTTNGTVYGYFIVDADANLIWAELFGSTFTPANNGDNIVLTPIIQMSKGTPS